MANKRKTNWRKHINIGTIMFLLIVVYLIGNLITLMFKSKLAVYEVSKSEISDTIKGTGIIIREEQLIKSTDEGYVNCYLGDGDRVKANGIVYTLDKTGQIQNEINKILEENKKTGKEEQDKINDDLRTFSDGYDDADFFMVSETKNEIAHDLISYTGVLLSKNKKKLEKKYGKDCYIEGKSEKTGLVSYSSDGLEGLNLKTLRKSVMNRKIHMKELRTNEKITSGAPVYRLTTSQEWKLAIPLSKEDYTRMSNLAENQISTLKVTIEKDAFHTVVPFEVYEQNNEQYLILNFSDYVQRYLNQRYLSVEILLVQQSGLTIPESSLVKKSAFRIPKDYLTGGSNSNNNNNVNVVYTDKKGREKLKQVSVRMIEEDTEKGTVTVFSTSLKKGDRIRNVESATTYSLDKDMMIYGVYTINSGYAVFSYVKIEERNEDYCIVNSDESEIQLYDRIVLNSNTIHENEIIY